MPSLEFVGKSRVRNHHRSGVPFRELVPVREKSLTENFSLDDNLIIHGDNLHALKALLPHYAGLVKCIYIDPPYNTGNEGWCYNDKVNSPKIREWIKQNANPVDGDDMLRHDKWLCMMWPRLQLLRELLADDGVIFISIDDNEQHHLRAMMDEIFGPNNFVGNLPAVMNLKGNNDEFGFAGTHEYVIVWAKSKESLFIGEFEVDEEDMANKWENDDLGFYKKGANLKATGGNAPREKRPNLYFPIYINKKNDIKITIDDKHPEGYEAVFPITSGEEMSWRWGKEKIKTNSYDIIVDRSTGQINLYKKQRPSLGDLPTKKPKTLLYKPEYSSGNGTALIKAIFPENNGKKKFENPKPLKLIEDLLSIATDKNAVVLDSFAGSGTTAHAVLALNKKDGGNRKFILVECEDYADKTTAERVRRVIKGIPKAKDENLEKGLGGSFTYCELGVDFDIEKMLSGESLPSYESLAAYIFKNCTGQVLKKEAMSRKNFFVGQTDQCEVYLIYKDKIEFLRDNKSGLTHENLEAITKTKSQKTKLVFATAQFVDPDLLKKEKVEFCLLPYAIHKIAG